MKRLCLALTLYLTGYALCQTSQEVEVTKTRQRIKPTVAKYKEEIRTANQAKPEPGKMSWGDHDSIEAVVCGVSPESTFIQRFSADPKKPLADGGNRVSIRRGGKTYDVIESGGRGVFGKHPSGEIVPIACGLEVDGLEFSEYCRLRELKAISLDSLEGSNGSEKFTVDLFRSNGQTLVRRAVGLGVNYHTNLEVKAWVEHDGMQWPKVVKLVFNKPDGTWFSTRTYTLIEFIDPKRAPFVAVWNEGATVKDLESGTVYMMQNGKLVPDPAFSKKTAEETTQRRLLFLACFLTAGGGIAYWLSRRSRAKAAQA
jgi:hypothetical protein